MTGQSFGKNCLKFTKSFRVSGAFRHGRSMNEIVSRSLVVSTITLSFYFDGISVLISHNFFSI
jgi:hypothetical protein